jgi:hypothetical protein
VLPYYNSANPSQPYSGPGNSGAAQNTRRLGVVDVRLKAGAAASAGAATAPSPDAGYVGLASVTVAQGATSVTAANIRTIATAPRINYPLPTLRPGFSQSMPFVGSGTSAASFNWTVPAGVTTARVRVKGGGGGGGGANAGVPGSGGGGGGYAEGYVTVTPGTVIPITCGGGGVAGVVGGVGGDGGSSSFGTLLSATGGKGGNPAGGLPGVGGTGTGGSTINAAGSGGGLGWPLTAGTVGGMGGASWDTPHSQFPVGSAGLAGSGYGGGGSGGGSSSTPTYFNGGQGGPGAVFVEF